MPEREVMRQPASGHGAQAVEAPTVRSTGNYERFRKASCRHAMDRPVDGGMVSALPGKLLQQSRQQLRQIKIFHAIRKIRVGVNPHFSY
jgi:hypothetical protein